MNKIASVILAIILGITPAWSQTTAPLGPTNGGGGGGGGGGSGTVTSIATGCQATGGTITTSGTISTQWVLSASSPVTSSPYAVATTDACNVLLLNSGASSLTLVAASTTGYTNGKSFQIDNAAGGSVTLTITTSTLDGASSVVIPNGWQIQFQSDGTNYHYIGGGLAPFNASNISSGTLAAARGGAGSTNGALKGNGSGAVSQAACADLSNGATGCSASTGTSGATLPFLNGTNTWSGVQTFENVFGTVSSQSGTTYTLASTDCGTEVAFTNSSAVTVTIPATLTTGCNIAVLQTTSAGQVTVTGTAVSAATLHSAHSYTKTFGQWSVIGINIYTTGVAILTGDGA